MDRTWLPAGVVPVVGARDQSEGGLGVLEFSHSSRSLGSPFADRPPTDASNAGSVETIDRAIALACEPLSEFLPESLQPHAGLRLEGEPSGDSLALPAALGALLWLFDCPWPEDLVATGGLSTNPVGFSPAVPDTLPAKARAARRWGFRRIALVEDPDDARTEIEGLEVVRLPREPAALPLAAASLDGVAFSEHSLARALAIFDLRVARGGPRSADRVLRATRPLLEVESSVIRHIAHDMRSRVQLHSGRTADSEDSLARADALRGQGTLPEGRLRDVLRYQQPAHRSMIHIDLGQWDDELPAHREVDELIDALDRLWPTRHERLMRFFLANTRARRNEYLGRIRSDPHRLQLAWDDLEHDRGEWGSLIEDFAIRELRLRDTSLARIQNQMIDVAYSHHQLEGGVPERWREVITRFEAQAPPLDEDAGPLALHCQSPGRGRIGLRGNGFDAVARYKRHRLLGRPGLPPEAELVLESNSIVPEAGLHFPWPHWLELVGAEGLDRRGAHPVPVEGAWAGALPAWRLEDVDPLGISSVLALRSQHVLRLLGYDPPEPAAPDPGTPLRELYDELRGDPDALLRRTPY